MEFKPSFKRESIYVKCSNLIVLRDDENVIITVVPVDLYSLIEEKQKQPNMDNDKIKITNTILEESKKVSVVDCAKIITDFHPYLSHILTDLIIDLVQEGRCSILDKKTLKYINEIEIETYDDCHHEMIGEGGRNFYLPKQKILNSVDWFS